MTFYIKQNDTSPSLLRTLSDEAGVAINLTGATVVFSLFNLETNTLIQDEGAVTLVDAANGVVRYDWVAADTVAAGSCRGEFKATYADTTIETFPNDKYIDIRITENL